MGPRFRAKSITFRPSKGESVHLHSSSRVTRTAGAGPLSPLLSSFPSHPASYLRDSERRLGTSLVSWYDDHKLALSDKRILYLIGN